MPASVRPGQAIVVAPLLRIAGRPAGEARLELQLIDGQGETLASAGWGQSPVATRLDGWPAGSSVRVPWRIELPGSAAGGRLRLRLAAIDSDTGRELGGADLGAATVEAVSRAFVPPPVDQRLEVTFGNEIRLIGFDRQPTTPRAGQPLRLRLVWQAAAAPRSNYHLFAYVLDDAGRILTQRDLPVTSGELLAAEWLPDQVGETELELLLPAAPPPGQVVLGLYDPATGRRLSVSDRLDGTWPIWTRE